MTDAARAQELTERYANLRRRKREIEQEAKDIAQEMKDVADVLWMFLDDNGTTFLKGNNKISVRLGTPRVKAWWKKEHDERVRAWLAEQGYEDVARGTVHWSTQCATVKDLLEQNIPLPEEIEYRLEPTIVVRDDR